MKHMVQSISSPLPQPHPSRSQQFVAKIRSPDGSMVESQNSAECPTDVDQIDRLANPGNGRLGNHGEITGSPSASREVEAAHMMKCWNVQPGIHESVMRVTEKPAVGEATRTDGARHGQHGAGLHTEGELWMWTRMFEGVVCRCLGCGG